jgi:nitroimidazol reductase NimA-like FMN-containing flavoprotein (pyridoxamine 5'-phosphate oxidase superfamily)
LQDHELTRVRHLSQAESLDLLRHRAYVGRLGFIAEGHPMILPVNYVASQDAIVFCTLPGTKLSAVGAGAEVVFEVGGNSPEYHAGWSVIVRGVARELTNRRKLERLQRGPLRSWAVRATAHWVEISVDEISGRIILGD